MSERQVDIAQNRKFSSGRVASRGTSMATASALMGVLSLALVACSATPDAVKPSAIYGDQSAAETPEGTQGFPELADTPDQRPDSTSNANQKSIADDLAAERDKARHNDEKLRKGEAPSGSVAPSAAELNALDKAAQQEVERPVRVAAAEPQAKPAPAPSPKPAPVAKAASAPEPVAAQSAAIDSTPEPAAAAEMAEAAAPVAAPAPVAPKPAPVVAAAPKPAPVEAPVFAEPAAQPSRMASVDAAPAVQDSTASLEAKAPALMLPPGVIPMPARGGHKTLAEVRPTPEKKAEAKAEDKDEDTKPVESEPYVGSAPTEKVIVEPAGASQP